MRKVVLYIALSLDGYIADKDGHVEWLGGQDDKYQGDYGYSEFISDIDTVIMGYTTYHQIVTELSPENWVYQGMQSYVLTHRNISDTNEIKFVNQPVYELISKLKRQEGKGIWICGGANVIHQLVSNDLIDEYHLTIIPRLIGGGIRLFKEHDTMIRLSLISSKAENGVLNCIYRKQ